MASFLSFCKKSGTVGQPTVPDFLAFQIQISRFPDFFPSYSIAMDTDSQARGGRGGRSWGVPNYRNDILINVVEEYHPQGLEGWRGVALAYQRESMEATLRWEEDLRDNWNRKLCNRMQKPTGKPGVLTFRCIEIERHIQDEANAAILGADLAESAHSRDDGRSALSDVVAEDTAFDDVGNDGDEEDEEVVAVNAAEDNENAVAVVMVCPRPQSLPVFVGRGVGVSIEESPGAFIVPGVGASSAVFSSSASRGGNTRKTNTPAPPRRSPTSLSSNISSGGSSAAPPPSQSGSTCGRIHPEKRKGRKSQFLFMAQLSRKTNLAEIFSKARSGTITHKNKKILTAVNHLHIMHAWSQANFIYFRAMVYFSFRKLRIYGICVFRVSQKRVQIKLRCCWLSLERTGRMS